MLHNHFVDRRSTTPHVVQIFYFYYLSLNTRQASIEEFTVCTIYICNLLKKSCKNKKKEKKPTHFLLDSNLRPSVREHGALPLRHLPLLQIP